MKKSHLFIILSLAILHIAHGQDNGFDKSYQPVTPPEGVKSSADKPKMAFSTLDSPLVDIVWCGANGSTIFILSEFNTLYRSVDDGFSGHTLTEHLQKLGNHELGQTEDEVGDVSRIIQSPVDPSLLIFLGTYGINWITEDCGNTIRAMNQGRRIEEFQFHPTQKNWVLASAWTLCEDFIDEPCRKYKELFVSKDLGLSWELISDYVFQFSWGKVDKFSSRIPDERVIIAHEPTGKGHQKLSGWSERINVAYSDDFFKTSNIKILAPGGNKFLVTTWFLFIVQVNDEDEQEVTLLSADSRDPLYKNMRPIELPTKHLLEHSYTILDTAEHSVFLQINHEGDRSKFGNVYVSDSTGNRFTLSLVNNVRNADGQADFERVQGLEGIYLSNVYESNAVKKYKNLQDDSGVAHQGVGAKKTSDTTTNKFYGDNNMGGDSYSKASIGLELEDFMQTKISFDKGSFWQSLTPPVKDSEGKRIYCEDADDCALHLHSISNRQFGPFYSTENSLGLILGTGNVGKHLSHRADEINTYFSRDGGLTWFEIAKGSHIYEIGDHGSIIVIAPDQYATTEIQYSWNEGLTWETLTISEVPIEISNIIIEPTNTAEKFIVYGRTRDTQAKGVVIAVDFWALHKRFCVEAANPGTATSDYELWSPNGKINQHCLLGKKMNYVRRKREAECFSSEEVEKWSLIDFCPCTEDDWECDFGYFRKDGKGPCISYNGKEPSHDPPEQCPNRYYEVTKGYRKVGGDLCQGGIDHAPFQIPCPGGQVFNSKSIGIFLSLVGLVLFLVWLSKNNNIDRLKDITGAVTNNFKFALQRKDNKPDTTGFNILKEVPDSLRDEDDDDYGKLSFDDESSQETTKGSDEDTEMGDTSGPGRKRTERKAHEAAQKKVPILAKPGGI